MPSRNTVEVVIQAKDEASQKVESIFSGITGQVAKVGLALQGMKTVIDGTIGSLSDMARSAATSMNVQAAFAGKVKESGKSVDEMLAALQKGSAGMITNTDLMKSYNTAAQLVGTTFANQLPDAMQYLTKVAAATGQDMSFMMDSMVRGVGRLSPMILDNLGIQVDLVSANETYAASIGKTVEELTKEEQQTALMNQVLEKLKTNTAAMPDVTDSAAAKFAQFDVKMKNLRGTIGRMVLPAFIALQDIISSVVSVFELLLTGNFKGGLFGLTEDNPVVKMLLAVSEAMKAIGAGVPVFDVLTMLFEDLANIAWDIDPGWRNVAEIFTGIYELMLNVLKPIGDWIGKNIELKDVLIALGLGIASIVLPALVGIGASLVGILAPIALVIGAVALVRKIWETDFGGIRTFITNQLLPALGQLWSWFTTEGLPAIRQILLDVYNNVFIPVFTWLGTAWETVIKPGLEAMWTWFTAEGWPTIRQTIEDVYLNVIKPAFEFIGSIWSLISPALGSVFGWFAETGWPIIKSSLEETWHTVLEPLVKVFQTIWEVIKIPLEAFGKGVTDIFNNLRSGGIQPLLDALQDVIDWATDAISKVSDLLGLSKPDDLLGKVGIGSGLTIPGATASKKSPNIFTGGLAGFVDLFNSVTGRALGGRGLPGMGYSTEPDEVFVPDRPGRFMRDGAGGNGTSITIQFNGTGGPSSQGEADAAGAMIVNSLRNLGVPVRA